MKLFSFAAALLLSTVALAETGSRTFEVKNARWDSKLNVEQNANGLMHVDYDAQTVSLTVPRRMPRCPRDMACIQVMPSPMIVQLPITDIKTDSCGIRTVVALKDQRPVDGILQKIKLVDASDATCQFFRAPDQPASYQTRAYDRMSSREIKTNSTMMLVLKARHGEEVESRVYNITSGEALSGFPSLEMFGEGALEITPDQVKLRVSRHLNCPVGTMCPAYMPMPLTAELDIVSVEQGYCGDRIVAQSRLHDQAVGAPRVTVEVVDYSRALCEMVILHMVTVDYTEQAISDFQGLHVKKARFYVDVVAQ
jgi:hypothetical protein